MVVYTLSLFPRGRQFNRATECGLGEVPDNSPKSVWKSLEVCADSPSRHLKKILTHALRGPVAILFISRDTCSDSIAKLFRACFCGYRTIIARYVAKWGIAQMCLCETKCQGGASHHFGEVLTSLKKYRAMWGIAAIVSQYRAIWGQ